MLYTSGLQPFWTRDPKMRRDSLVEDHCFTQIYSVQLLRNQYTFITTTNILILT